MKVAVIGVGNMGSKYASLIQNGEIAGLELSALTRVKEQYKEKLKASFNRGLPVFDSADSLFEAVEKGELDVEAVIITTPHVSHPSIAKRAFKNKLHVLCDKPAAVLFGDVVEMIETANSNGCHFAMVYNQRTNPLYIRMHEIVKSGQYGQLKRVNWVVTDWYRPDKYYSSTGWRATWETDGGGVLLNQCPHNLDLLQWICGMPVRVQGFCHNGRFHDIEVEDDVTAYLEWENGALGTFITSTGDAPGINRLEITLDEAMLVCENGELRIGEIGPEIGMSESEYRNTSTEFFRKLKGVWRTEKPEATTLQYALVLRNFSNVCNGIEADFLADGSEGRYSQLIIDGIYLSSWKHEMVELPKEDTEEERLFSEEFKDRFEMIRMSRK